MGGKFNSIFTSLLSGASASENLRVNPAPEPGAGVREKLARSSGEDAPGCAPALAVGGAGGFTFDLLLDLLFTSFYFYYC